MAKKQRSAKQKANDRRLGRLAKARAAAKRAGSKVKRRASSAAKRVKSTAKRRVSMARPKIRRPSRKMLGLSVKQGVKGGAIGEAVDLVMERFPQTRSFAKDAGYIAAAFTGQKSGVVGKFLIDQGLRRSGILSRFGVNGGGSSQNMMAVTAGA